MPPNTAPDRMDCIKTNSSFDWQASLLCVRGCKVLLELSDLDKAIEILCVLFGVAVESF